MDQTFQLLLALIRYDLFQIPLPVSEFSNVSEEILEQLYQLSDKHDLAHLAGDALYKNDLLPKDSPAAAKFQKAQVLALYRYTRMEHERKQIYTVFEKEGIPFVPLKGLVIRPLYPQPHLRTSCDLDILVHREDVTRASDVLVHQLNYRTDQTAQYHDISLFSPSDIHLELHFSIQEDMPRLDQFLSQVWTYASPSVQDQWEFRLTPEFFMFHHIAHMAYHFVSGGCGIRPLADLYLLRQKISFDETVLLQMCETCGLKTFYERIIELNKVWFENFVHNETTYQLQSYLLYGGVYGSMEHSLTVKQQQHGGKGKYILHRIFMPYRYLKTKYPILDKHKWLFPIMTVRRWFSLLSPSRRKRVAYELKKSSSLSSEEQESTLNLLSDLDLL